MISASQGRIQMNDLFFFPNEGYRADLRHRRQREAQARQPLWVRRPGREPPLDLDKAASSAAAPVGAADETQLVGAGEQGLYSDKVAQQRPRWELG